MKRKEFIRELEKSGCVLHRHGSRHDIYLNPTTGQKSPVPHHTEIKNSLCRLIRKQLGLIER
ncbi:type II toxin-antitoxin system HicA family toxin [Acaryochloris sp. IP29b_bin.137]|uniref:type II toxin-antitoxin system HicA family toxin n=1 Tax=Acaryochloris sp. IP29b_bin.137 TaxID=2969217 RepID=UPI002604ED88|nr:type II toxin-antitoxin system HicA family toxin [Acaryochloris sp. IP29b_bin.137]